MRSTALNILQTVAPDYRVGLFRELESLGLAPKVWCGENCFATSTKTSSLASGYVQPVKNHFFLNRHLLWQSGIWPLALMRDPIVVNFNNRIISTTLLMAVRRCLGFSTILWGHASGQSRFGALLRVPQLLLANAFIAYTKSQRHQMRLVAKRLGLQLSLYAANNACLSERDCWPEAADLDSIIYVGRLTEAKKPILLLEAFALARLNGQLSTDIQLVFVGDGPLRASLDQRIDDLNLSDSVVMLGHISNVAQLRKIYARAICSVSPGYVGLSVTQSLGFGVPLAVADNEPHSPEIEACLDGFNSHFFEANSPAALACILGTFHAERLIWADKREALSRWTADRYSYEAMADAFVCAFADLSYASPLV